MAADHGAQIKSDEKVNLTSNCTLFAHWALTAPNVTAGRDLSLSYGYKDGSISVTAEAAEGSKISAYQWYTCDENGENAAAIEGATGESYAIETGKSAGTYYYFCEVTAKHSENDDTSTARSAVITVAVGRTIRNAEVTMTGYVYGKTPAVPEVTGNNENGEVTFYYTTESTNKGGTVWDVQNPPTLTVGTYYLYATIAATVNYSEFTTPAVPFEVTKADPAVTWPTISGAVYVNDAALGDDRLTGGVGEGTFTITGEKTWSESGEKAMKVTFTPSDSTNYNELTNFVTVTVSKRTVECVTTDPADVTGKDYGTAQAELGLPGTVSIRTEDGKTFDNIPVNWTGYDPEKLDEQALTGTLDLTAISAEVEQPENAVTASVSVTLNRLTPGTVNWGDKAATYTGTSISNEIASLPAGVASVTYTYTGTGDTDYAASATAPIHAGTYTVTAHFTMAKGYAELADATAQLTIEKANASLTAPEAAENLVYNGKSQTLITAGESADGEMQYRLDDGEYGTDLPAAAAAGTYRITYKVVGDGDHNDSAEGSFTVTIGRKPIDLPARDTTEFVYNGKAQTYRVAESGDYTVSGTEQTAAGTYSVKLTLTDPDNTMWKESQNSEEQSFDFLIHPAELTLTVADKSAYVGGKAPSLSDPKLGTDYTVTGFVEEENEEITGLTLSYDPAEPDMTKPGEAAINAANASAGTNYTIVYKPGKLTISYYPATLYTPSVAPTENGTVTVSPVSAGKGATVTVIPKPDEGYRVSSVTVTDRNGNEIPVTEQDGVYTFVQPDGPVTVTVRFAKAAEAPAFRDVSDDAYYAEAVRWAVENGITDGVGNDLFAPDRLCTRSEIATFLWRAAGSPEPKSTVSFTDVPAGSYYAKAVAWAVENGIAFGVGNNAFAPDETCTRAQSAAFLFRACGSGTEGEVPFRDVTADSYYAEAVKWAAESGVTNGVGDGLFAPDRGCTRAQIVTFLYRTYQKEQ